MEINNNRVFLPNGQNKDSIFNLFMKNVCKNDEIWINGEQLFININYRITDPNYGKSEKIVPEIEGLYTQSPILEINNVNLFKSALFDFVKAYTNKESLWTRPYDKDWMNIAIYGMGTIWTDATNQDFSNPLDFLKRYTSFLTQDQWEDLKTEKEIGLFNDIRIWEQTKESYSERETPNNYSLFIKDNDGKKIYFPSICYGIQNHKAYIYAIHQIHEKNMVENEDIQTLRKHIKGRGVEPLGIATLISFIEESKKRGIEQIVFPDNFVLQYTSKNRLKEHDIKNKYFNKTAEEISAVRDREEEELDYNHRGRLDKRLMAMFLVSKYYSTGIKFTEIPGEVSDNLTADIHDFKIGREEKKQEDRRNKKRIEEER